MASSAFSEPFAAADARMTSAHDERSAKPSYWRSISCVGEKEETRPLSRVCIVKLTSLFLLPFVPPSFSDGQPELYGASVRLDNAFVSVFTDPSQETAAVLLSVVGAIIGVWLSAGASRRQARKQHTVTVLLDASMNEALKNAIRAIIPNLETQACPDFSSKPDEVTRRAFGLVLNHYEFIAAGIRNRDFDEVLVYDSECRNILDTYETYLPNIEKRREQRNLSTIFEHLTWLHRRWSKRRPKTLRRAWHDFWFP